MSQCFRPVKEIWITHFVLFRRTQGADHIAPRPCSESGYGKRRHSYGDNTLVWLENGKKFLDYIQFDRRFSALSFKDSLDEQGVIVDEDALVPLLTNMRLKTCLVS
jgi:hypothetical protein